MKVIIFFICVPFVYSELHKLMTTYTGIGGNRTTGTPEFIAVTTLDGEQIDYYDSNIGKLIPKRDWMEEYSSKDKWKIDTEIRRQVHQIYRNNIYTLMQRFKQISGVHVYQRMYGCEWDDQTRDSDGFDQYGYDGEDYISLDVKEGRYITPVQQGIITVQKWNNNRAQLELEQHYFNSECIKWLKKFWTSRKPGLESRAPKVYLLQRNSSSPVVCLATGFYPSEVTVIWKENEKKHTIKENNDKDVALVDTLPNEDGTFQRKAILAHKWENHQYTCVVEHQGQTIWKILTEENKTNKKSAADSLSNAENITSWALGVAILVFGALTSFCIWIIRKVYYMKCKSPSKTTTKATNTQHLLEK